MRRVPDEVDSRLEARARRLGTTKSELSREALRRLLEDEAAGQTHLLTLDPLRTPKKVATVASVGAL